MLAEGQGLRFIGRAETDAVQPIGNVKHRIIDDFKKGLPVVNKEGDVVRAHLKDDLCAFEFPVGSITKSRIEKAGVVRAEFPAGGFVRNKIEALLALNTDPFFRGKDVKFFRFQQETVLAVPVQGFPKISGRIISDLR